MLVYHGSNVEISKPDVFHSRKALDFGKGFYLTTYKEQAQKWAIQKKKNNSNAYVTTFDLSDSVFEELKILKFSDYNKDWLDFVCSCRKDKINESSLDYDIIIGNIADDKVFTTVELYESGVIDAETTIKKLKYFPNNDQIVIKKQEVIEKYLTYVKGEIV